MSMAARNVRPPVHRPLPSSKESGEQLLHLGTRARPPGPDAASPIQSAFEHPKPYTCAFSPLASIRVIPSVEPHRPDVHAVVNGAILQVNSHRGEHQ